MFSEKLFSSLFGATAFHRHHRLVSLLNSKHRLQYKLSDFSSPRLSISLLISAIVPRDTDLSDLWRFYRENVRLRPLICHLVFAPSHSPPPFPENKPSISRSLPFHRRFLPFCHPWDFFLMFVSSIYLSVRNHFSESLPYTATMAFLLIYLGSGRISWMEEEFCH